GRRGRWAARPRRSRSAGRSRRADAARASGGRRSIARRGLPPNGPGNQVPERPSGESVPSWGFVSKVAVRQPGAEPVAGGSAGSCVHTVPDPASTIVVKWTTLFLGLLNSSVTLILWPGANEDRSKRTKGSPVLPWALVKPAAFRCLTFFG